MSRIPSDVTAAIIGTLLAMIGITVVFWSIGSLDEHFRSGYLFYAGICVGISGLVILGSTILENREVRYWHPETVRNTSLAIITIVGTSILGSVILYVVSLFPYQPR